MITVSLFHPFTAKAIGLKEEDLYNFHSKPHEQALATLQKEGYTVTIDYFTGCWFPYKKEVNGILKRYWPITFPLFKNRHQWRKQKSWWHQNKVNARPPDVTIINMSGHGSPYCFKLAKMLIKKGKPYISMIGGIHISEDSQAKEYYQNAHHIIVHTEVQKKQLLTRETFKELNIQVMPLGIDTSLFIPKEKDQINFELLFVGRISRLKQIELCLETVAFLLENKKQNLNLTIVGPVSDDEYFLELQALTRTLQIEKHVKFEGSLKQKQLVPFYRKANLLLLPSAHESFGMVIVEAMACGTPVAALKGSGGPDEIVKNGFNGILANRETYAQRILEYFNSPNMQQQLHKNTRLDVEKKWSSDQTVVALKDSIDQVFVTL